MAQGFQMSVKLLKLVYKIEYCLCIFLGRVHNFIKFSEGPGTQKQSSLGLKTLGALTSEGKRRNAVLLHPLGIRTGFSHSLLGI